MKLPAVIQRYVERHRHPPVWPVATAAELDLLCARAVPLLADLADFLTYGRMKFEFGNIGFFETLLYNTKESTFEPAVAGHRFPDDATGERMEKVKAKLVSEASLWLDAKLRERHDWLRCAPILTLVVRTPDLGLELWPRAHQDDGYRWRLVLDRRDLTRIGRVEVVDHPRLRVQANLSANQRANLADLHPESFDRLSDDFALLRQRFPKVLEYREREWVSLGG